MHLLNSNTHCKAAFALTAQKVSFPAPSYSVRIIQDHTYILQQKTPLEMAKTGITSAEVPSVQLPQFRDGK